MDSENQQPHLIGGVEKRVIDIVAYDPSWPETYTRHNQMISQALGKTALQIEHIGSTAVPQLPAKPIIDILVVVPDSAHEPAYLPALENACYELRVREPDWHQHRMVRTPSKDVHIHVYSQGCPEIERNLLFREWLRAHPDDRQLYAQTKQSLAGRDWPDMNAYADAKTYVIERILSRARR